MISDLRFAFRQLLKSPGFAAVAILTLALGIGATTSIYTVVDTVLWRPLPYAEPDELVEFRTVLESGSEFGASWPLASLAIWREQTQLFAQVEAHSNRNLVVTGHGDPQNVNALAVTPGLFSLLGKMPTSGRPLRAADAEAGNARVVIVSHAFWQQQLGSAPFDGDATIMLDDVPHTVVGAMPAGFAFPRSTHDLWIPLRTTSADEATTTRVDLVARLRPGLDVTTANRDSAPLVARLREEGFMPRGGQDIRAHALDEIRANPAPRRAMLIFLGAVGFVLLIACANVANLLLVRGTARAREFAIRAALGAGRSHIARLLLHESLLIAIGGAVTGLLLTVWSIKAMWALAPTELTFLTVNEVAVDSRVLLLTLGTTIATALLCGLVPTWRACRRDLTATFADASRSSSAGAGRSRLQSALTIGQVALSFVLLIGAGLMLRSFAQLSNVPPGFDPKNVVAMQVRLPDDRYPSRASRDAFFAQLEQRLTALPGVIAVTTAAGIPPRNAGFFFTPTVDIDGRGNQPLGAALLPYNIVVSDYFQVMRIPMLRGRSFGQEDLPGGPAAVIISETMARRFWPDTEPLGQRFRLNPQTPWMNVVGVAGDVRAFGLRDEHGDLEFYLATTQQARPPSMQDVIIRTAGNPGMSMAAFKEQVWALDDKLPISRLETAEAALAESTAETRFYATIVGVFADVAVVLAAIGIYGVMAYVVEQRTRELGIRLALGAQRRAVFALVLRRGLLLTLAGTTLGLGAALGLTRFLESLLFGISPHDPLTFALVAFGLVGVAVFACQVPARRAARVDPIEALRAE